jgi:hypothetical protein
MKYWVGVLKGKYQGHDVIEDNDPTEERYKQKYDYLVGPFDDREKAVARAATERNCAGTFQEINPEGTRR